MKVLALVVLVIAISGLEAGVVKRDAQDPLQQISDIFQGISKSIQEQIANAEIPSQAQDLGTKLQEQGATISASIQKWIEELVALSKQKLS
ncbi:apolipoprotein A-II [Aquarana catesbeiana]|uniref:apolipoprotein A-II n=1 Tax=Aquarana catesbeiana TaxID=8400 RepID=UPI003CCA6523